MQESFQLHPDEGESSDHSFRTAARVKTFFRTGKVYSATYDSLSLYYVKTKIKKQHSYPGYETSSPVQVLRVASVASL